MTVPVQTDLFNSSTANGLTTTFPYGFKITAAEDLTVEVDGVKQTSGYSVTGVGNTSGGNVVFSVAPISGKKVLRYLDPVLKRETDYQQFGDWIASIVNLDFDRIWLAIQTMMHANKRSLKLPVDTATDQVLTQDAAARANKGLKFDASGNVKLTDYDPDSAQDDAAAQVVLAEAQVTLATTQAGLAASAKVAAEAARDAVLTAYDNFDDRYLGAKSDDPTVDNDGNALVAGSLYFHTGTPAEMRIYTGAAWVAAYVSGAGFCAVSQNLADLTDKAAARTNLSLVPGTDIEAKDTNILRANASKNLTAGYTASSANGSTKSSGTFTPDPASGNFQHYTNGGAHTLAPPSSVCSIMIEIVNNASAGAITTSGFTKVVGDSLDTVDGNKFQVTVTKTNTYSSLVVLALQS